MNMAASSSAAADVLPQQKYDVFLSFRGEDTRRNFISHLYAALKRKQIHTYMDDKSLESGEEIGPALLTAIEQSKLSIIIFSKHYASSRWCLDELVHILKCQEAYGQLVVPVFYEIDPSDVRRQKQTYADAFTLLEERFKDNRDKLSKWRDAVTTAANLSGFHSQSKNIKYENELVEAIVKDILTRLNRNVSYPEKRLVGMDNHIHQLEKLLCIPAQDVCFRTVGIWGMGGCGKTTLADVVFHRNSSKFHAFVFLANVREQSEFKHGLYHLRNKLVRELLKEEHLSIDSPSIGSPHVIDRLSRTKVLAVLDDVSDVSQLDFLLGDEVQFGPGSRIIITTRNRRLLKKRVHDDHIYKVSELSVVEALQLFQSFAFEDGSSIKDYSTLSKKVVDYAGRNPLAVKVLASSFLHCNNKEVWKEELKKLKTFPNKKIQNALRLSYDGLEENEKEVFLDIACFLRGENICDAKRILEIRGFSPLSGINILNDMSLISIINDRVEMHDLLQEMGRTIDGGIEELGKRKRLWNAKDCYQVLHNETGTSRVEAICLDMSKIRELQLSPTAIKSMHNLKLLKFYVPREVHEEWIRQKRWTVKEKQPSPFPWLPIPMARAFQCFLAKSRIWGSLRLLDSYNKVCDYDDEVFRKYWEVHFPRGLESLPEELRYLYWDGYPWKSLPSKYFPEQLVEIHMPHSQVKQLWNNGQNLGSLKRLNLDASQHLIEVPDLSRSPNIERIYLRWCERLVEVPSYFQNLENLTYLDLDGCKNLKIFPAIPCNIEFLRLRWSGIEEIPPSIWSHEKLHTLDLLGCFKLKRWPFSSSVVGRLCSLKTLNLRYGSVSEIPDSLNCLSTLQDIDLSGNMIEKIPASIKYVSGLRWLCLLGCEKLRFLPELPSQLEELDVGACWSLKSVASSRSTLMQPREQYKRPRYGGESGENIIFTDCFELDESAKNNIMDDAELRITRMASSKHEGCFVTVYCPGNEIPRWFSYQSEGCEINISKFLHLHDTTSTVDSCLGFALSAVVADSRNNDRHGFRLVCEYNLKTNNDGEGYRGEFKSNIVSDLVSPGGVNLMRDHVVVFFRRHGFNKVTEASFRFHPDFISEQSMKVKKCGIQILYNL